MLKQIFYFYYFKERWIILWETVFAFDISVYDLKNVIELLKHDPNIEPLKRYILLCSFNGEINQMTE